MLASGDAYFFQLRAVGGAVSDVAEDATAYAHRAANFSVAAIGADSARLEPRLGVRRGAHHRACT